MTAALNDLRPVHVVGVGLHPYRKASSTPYPALGLTAVRAALADAGIQFEHIESVYTGTAQLGMAVSRPMLRYLGTTGIPMTQIENASASGSTAVRQACYEVASGVSEVALAIGIDKPAPIRIAGEVAGVPDLVSGSVAPFMHFALLANDYMHRFDVSAEDVAKVVVKNSRNARDNPNAQRREAHTLEEVLGSPPIAGTLTRLQCCPVGEGAAAVVVASDDAIRRLGIDRARSVRVLSSVLRTEQAGGGSHADAQLTRLTAAAALAEAETDAAELDVIEFHDAFAIEELLYLEAVGLSPEGGAAADLARGEFDIGGRCAVSASGGLLCMGHPIGPTGVGQICEITTQLRGEAGARQQPAARLGLAHMVGLGSVCAVHVLAREA